MSLPKTPPLISTRSPSLPVAPVDYTQQYMGQMLNVMRLYFNQIDNFTRGVSNPPYGPTADRPTPTAEIKVVVGQFYFDTTLGYPIWFNGTDWVDASGTVV